MPCKPSSGFVASAAKGEGGPGGATWVIDYNTAITEDDEAGFRLDRHVFALGARILEQFRHALELAQRSGHASAIAFAWMALAFVDFYDGEWDAFEQRIVEDERSLTLRDGQGRSIYFARIAPGESTFHRREKLPRSGHPLRDLANRIAADLGVGEFDLYLTAAQARDEEGRPRPLYFIEPLETPGLVLSSSLVDGASEAERRFFLGGLLKLLQSQLVLPLRLLPDDLGVLVGGMVRQFVPDYAPLGFAEKRIVNEASRLKRAIPSKLQPLLLPHAMECAQASLDFDGISEALVLASHFAGLLLCGSLPSAVVALRRKGPDAERQIDDLLRFAISPECADLFRIAAGG